MIECIFSETYTIYEKNLNQLEKHKLIKLYRALSIRYNKPFYEISKNCKIVNIEEDIDIPKTLNERDYDNKEYSDLLTCMLEHTFKRIDKVIIQSLERVCKENTGLIILKNNLDLIQDTHKKSQTNGYLCLGINTKGTVCCQRAVRTVGKFQFCKKCAKNATIEDVPVRTYHGNIYSNSDKSNSDNSDDDDNPFPCNTHFNKVT
tara:strand:+ start:3472 stop:4083 length:612 start_codon:yes stop_codon:yes gene_type:complete